MYSKAIIVGFLTRDPEQRQAGDKIVCSFGVAANNSKSDVCFMDVEVWGAKAEFVMKYFTKGKPIVVEGILRQNTWEKEGKKISKHIIVADKVAFVGMPRETGALDTATAVTHDSIKIPQPIKKMVEDIFGASDDLPF